MFNELNTGNSIINQHRLFFCKSENGVKIICSSNYSKGSSSNYSKGSSFNYSKEAHSTIVKKACPTIVREARPTIVREAQGLKTNHWRLNIRKRTYGIGTQRRF